MITPEPSDSLMRSCGMSGNRRRKNGSLKNGLRTRTTCLVLMLTTAGIAFCSIGASDGTGVPSTTGGNAASVGTAIGVAASARLSRMWSIAVAAKPPNAAAKDRASRVGSGRRRVIGVGCRDVDGTWCGAEEEVLASRC
jgi:hypothetical protein